MKKAYGAILAFALIIVLLLSSCGALAARSEPAIYPLDGINPQHNFQSNYSAKDNNGALLRTKYLPYVTVGWVFDDKYMYILKGFPPTQYIVEKYDIQ
ncbi:MAG: hypothetical protein GXO25_05570, partial [Euryarchaeota archaeon]|nr:hypothetical protein [Euryarchaeota archaeon]